MKWYVAHTYASHEFKIKEAILNGVKGTPFEEKVGQILVPTQKTFHMRDGKKVEREKKIFNSYIIIEAELTPDVFSFIVGMPGITNFLGAGKRPHALSEVEVNRLLGISDRNSEDTRTYEFIPGDMVKITSGPFTDFEGVIDKNDEEHNKLNVKVTVFGRETSVEVKSEDVEIL
ncbi:MAG: transcription termination/antitermination factor NusG [Candidatus Cloacimonetes bacterium]|nr:transcription termination/antitermination factor NusG [Candidatus Cloacimonadota bacterium]